jgi:hypothetical protein
MAVAASLQTTTPKASLRADGELLITLPTSAIRDREVAKQLDSGLTTAFVATVEGTARSGASLRGALRVEIRYELWDEAYLVRVTERDGALTKVTLPTRDRLMEWWSSTPIRAAHLASASDAPDKLRVRVDVVPFSAGEEADAQRWLVQSVGDRVGSGPGGSQTKSDSAGALLDLLIGTSVQRRPLQSWRWVVPVTRAR